MKPNAAPHLVERAKGLLGVPPFSGQAERIAALHDLVVRFLQGHLAVVGVGKGDSDGQHAPSIAISEIDALGGLAPETQEA